MTRVPFLVIWTCVEGDQMTGVGGPAVVYWTAKRESRYFCSMRTPTLGPQVSGYQSQSQAWKSPRVRKRRSTEWVQVVKKKHERNPVTQTQKRGPGNTKTWKKAKEKALDTNGLCA